MANLSTTGYGLKAIETLGSTPSTQGQSKYPILSGLGVRILKNEPVGPQHTDGDDGSVSYTHLPLPTTPYV